VATDKYFFGLRRANNRAIATEEKVTIRMNFHRFAKTSKRSGMAMY
jgi:hypothetical protein